MFALLPKSNAALPTVRLPHNHRSTHEYDNPVAGRRSNIDSNVLVPHPRHDRRLCNVRTGTHFERNPAVIALAKTSTVDASMATVYLIRPKALGQALFYIPVPPLYYAADGQILAAMPLGTYVQLKLPPGSHQFTAVNILRDVFIGPKIIKTEVQVELKPGMTYYISSGIGWIKASFEEVSEAKGISMVSECELAKIFNAPYSIANLESSVISIKPSGSAVAPSSQLTAALPTSKQVGEFFEVVVTVALIAIIIAGAIAGATGSYANSPPILEPVFIVPAYYQRDTSTNTVFVKTTSGVRTDLSTKEGQTRLRNLSTGVTYTIEGDRIRGTDGSRYRVSGSTIYSDSGAYYKKIGNYIIGSDGSRCNIIGSQITC